MAKTSEDMTFERELPTFAHLKNAVVNGNHQRVAELLSREGCETSDPLEDPGYPDEDGYNSTVSHSLLYEAVSFPAVLKVLLNDARFNPNEKEYDAFYQCLNLGLVGSLKCFLEDGRFVIPGGTLRKAAELGGYELIDYLLTVPAIVGNPSLYPEMHEALQISAQSKDKKIVGRFLECYHQQAIPIPELLKKQPLVSQIMASYDSISEEVIATLEASGIPEHLAREITHSLSNRYTLYPSIGNVGRGNGSKDSLEEKDSSLRF